MKRTIRRIVLCLCATVSLSFGGPQRATGPADAIRLNNLGVAYMGQARIAEALQTFRRAAAQDPMLFAARLNEGIALLNSQQVAEARDVLAGCHEASAAERAGLV